MRFRAPSRAISTALLLGAGLLVAPGVAFAADPSPQDISQARDLGQQAQAALDAGNYAEAEKLWAGASNLYPAAPTLTLGLARTQAKLGKLVLARESYNKIIREHGTGATLSPAFRDALDAANAEVTAVSARIASVVITVQGASSPHVMIDGETVPPAGLGLKRPIDPGSHTVKADAPGFAPAETSFQVAEGGSADAKLELKKETAAAPATGAGAVDTGAPRATPPTTTRHTLALAAFGVGGLGLAVGAVTGILAIGKHGDLADRCPADRCPPSAQDDIDSYKTMGTISTIGFIVGGVGVAAGAVLWFTAPKESNAAKSAASGTGKNALSWHPFIGAGTAGVAGRF